MQTIDNEVKFLMQTKPSLYPAKWPAVQHAHRMANYLKTNHVVYVGDALSPQVMKPSGFPVFYVRPQSEPAPQGDGIIVFEIATPE